MLSAYRLPAIRTVWVALFALVLSAAAVCMAPVAHAQTGPTFPALSGRVVDQASLLDPAVEADLTAKSKGLEDATTDQLVIVTVNSLEGYEIEEYGYRLGREWGIGQASQTDGSNDITKKDNGILLIVAPNDRKVRIEVGYGLEPVIPDVMAHHIIQTVILPRFREGDMQGGVVAGTDAILQQLSADRGVALQRVEEVRQQATAGEGEGLPLPIVIFIIIIFLLFGRGWAPWFLLGALMGGGRGGGWSGGGGGFGGGGFGGGGGGFGGGGASGGW